MRLRRLLLPTLSLVAVGMVACGTEPAADPVETAAPPPANVSPSPSAEADAVDAEQPSPTPSADPRYDTCGEANEAGYGPYRRDDDPEYGWYQDRDGDGVVCETG